MTTILVLPIQQNGFSKTYIASDTQVSASFNHEVTPVANVNYKIQKTITEKNEYLVSLMGNTRFVNFIAKYDYSQLEELSLTDATIKMSNDLSKQFVNEHKEVGKGRIAFCRNGESLIVDILEQVQKADINVVMPNALLIEGSGSIVNFKSFVRGQIKVKTDDFFTKGDFTGEAVLGFFKTIMQIIHMNDQGTSKHVLLYTTEYHPEMKEYLVANNENQGFIKGIASTNQSIKRNCVQGNYGSLCMKKSALIDMATKINQMAKTSTPVPITVNHGGVYRDQELTTPHKFQVGYYKKAYIVEDEKKKIQVRDYESNTIKEEPYVYLMVEGQLDLHNNQALDFYDNYKNNKKEFGFSIAVKARMLEDIYGEENEILARNVKKVDLSAITMTYIPFDKNARIVYVASDGKDNETAPNDEQPICEIDIENIDTNIEALKKELEVLKQSSQKENTLLQEENAKLQEENSKFSLACGKIKSHYTKK